MSLYLFKVIDYITNKKRQNVNNIQHFTQFIQIIKNVLLNYMQYPLMMITLDYIIGEQMLSKLEKLNTKIYELNSQIIFSQKQNFPSCS